ncbi:MAG: hypothetical protein E7020_04560 [Alphaproteobacteria bacterium]|nr:hypothetical protein [Alphaproteobacteria bacterium]
MPLQSVSNKVDGVAGWDKSVVDVNNVDENFANARDLGYSRLNRTRVSVIGRLGKYDSSDLYKIQVQSNGKLFVNLRTGSDEEEKVLDLSKHEQRLEEIKAQLESMGIKNEDSIIDTTPKTPLEIAKAEIEKMKAEREKEKAGLLDDIAPGMTIKVYTQKGNRTVCVGDSTADKNSKEYATMKSILSGEYKAKKGMYYIEVGSEESLREENAYVMQIKQGSKYTDDYLVTEANSQDTKNETISITSSTSSSEQISAAYAAQIQAMQYDSTATMMSNAYTNLASIKNKQNSTVKLFSSLVNKNV